VDKNQLGELSVVSASKGHKTFLHSPPRRHVKTGDVLAANLMTTKTGVIFNTCLTPILMAVRSAHKMTVVFGTRLDGPTRWVAWHCLSWVWNMLPAQCMCFRCLL